MTSASLPEGTTQLVQLARNGDRRALDELVSRFHPRLLERVRLMMGPRARRVAEPEDFAQGVMAEAVRGLADGSPHDERRFLQWLTGIARNKIRQATRKRRESALESLSASISGAGQRDPSAAAELAERLEQLVDALEQLDEHHRAVIELRALEGQSFADVAAEMGRSPDAVRMLYYRAIFQLGWTLRGKPEGRGH